MFQLTAVRELTSCPAKNYPHPCQPLPPVCFVNILETLFSPYPPAPKKAQVRFLDQSSYWVGQEDPSPSRYTLVLFTIPFNPFPRSPTQVWIVDRVKHFPLFSFQRASPRSSCDPARAELGEMALQSSLRCHGPARRGHRRVRPEDWDWAPGHAPAGLLCSPAGGTVQKGAGLGFLRIT